MMPLEVAMKFSHASNQCEKYKCPYAAQCKGDYVSCPLKEVALIIRSQSAEIESLKSMVMAFQNVLASTQKYIADLESINKQYHDIVLAFEHGYRPKPRPGSKKKPRRVPKKKDLIEMDGDERYAQEPPRVTEPQAPLVVI